MRTIFSRLVLLLALFSYNCFGQTYQLTDLGAVIGTNSYAQGINNQGQVVGYWYATNGAHAFLYQSGTVTDLGLLGMNGTNNYALSINNVGQIVGFSETTNGSRAFLFQNGAIANLGSLGGLGSYAYGINGGGQIVGYVATLNGSRAFLFDSGNLTDLGTLGGTNSLAFGINNSLQVAGFSFLADNVTAHAFLWQNGVINDLNQIQAYNNRWQLTVAHGINDWGNMVGWGVVNGQEHAFSFSGSGFTTDLGVLTGGTNSYALGLNNSNQIVGASSSSIGSRAVFWQNGFIDDLNNLINASGWELREASGINDLGQIVGWGVVNGQGHAFLLTPVKTSPKSKSLPSGAGKTLIHPLLLPPSGGSLTVTITNPVNNAAFFLPTNITINAATTDSGGTVTQVQFFVGSKLLGTDTSPPYNVIWTNATMGLHSLTAIAMDDAGVIATSSIVNVVIGTNLPPVADAFVRFGAAYQGLNFGTSNILESQKNGTDNLKRDTYFKFDLSNLNGITNVQLRVFAALDGAGAVSNTIYSVSDTTWVETNITWNNAPALGTPLITNSMTGTVGSWYLLDVTAYINSQMAAGQNLVTLAMHDPINTSILITANSRENTTNQPSLVIMTTNSPLSVSITSPTNNAILTAPASFTINATAADSDGTVTQVQFFQGTNSLGISTNSPYSVFRPNSPPGIYTLTAIAADDAGLSVTSSAVNVIIGTNLAPVADAFVRQGSAYVNVNFGTTNILESEKSSTTANNRDTYFKFDLGSLNGVTNVQLCVFAALDGAGAVSNTIYSVSDTTWVETNITWNNAPALGTPLITNSMTGTVGSWYFSDVTAYVKSQIAAGHNLITLATHDPNNTSFLITANSRENSTNQPSLVVISTNNIPPTVTLTNPANNSVIVAGSNVSLGASAADADGAIAQVQFFQGTNSLGIDTTAPYSLTWSNVASGIYTLTACATDNGGLAITSSVVKLIVDTDPTNTDRDGDGASDWQEYLDGSDPTDPNSVAFKVFITRPRNGSTLP